MTGTDAACLHTNQSRSYLNHLVHTRAYILFGPTVPDNCLSAGRIRHKFMNSRVVPRTFAYVRGGCIVLCKQQRFRKTLTRSKNHVTSFSPMSLTKTSSGNFVFHTPKLTSAAHPIGHRRWDSDPHVITASHRKPSHLLSHTREPTLRHL